MSILEDCLYKFYPGSNQAATRTAAQHRKILGKEIWIISVINFIHRLFILFYMFDALSKPNDPINRRVSDIHRTRLVVKFMTGRLLLKHHVSYNALAAFSKRQL